MAEYDAFAALANRLILKKGRKITLRQLSAVATDPTKPWKGTGAPTAAGTLLNVPAVFLPASGSGLGKDIVSEELLKKVTQVALIPPLQEGLDVMHEIVDTDGTIWKIDWAQVLKPATQTVLYVFGLTR